MNHEPNVITSFFAGKCPKCRTGKVFAYSVFNLLNFSEVHKHCPACGVKIESEIGFFWGAMYFSYALNVAISVITGLTLFYFFNDPELWIYISVIIPTIIILTPPMTRFSRLMMMYAVAPYRKYNPNALKSKNQ